MVIKEYLKDMKKSTGIRGFLYIILKFLQALFPTIMVFVLAALIDYLLAGKGVTVRETVWKMTLVIVAVGCSKCVDALVDITKNDIDLACTIFFKEKLSIKLSKIHYINLENVEILDLIKRTKEDMGERTSGFISNVLSLGAYIIKIAGIVLLVGYHVWWIGALILLILFVLIGVSFKAGQEEYDAFEEAETYQRKAEAMNEILHDREYALERKLYDYADYIQERFVESYEIGRKKEFEAQVKSFGKSWIMNILTTIFSFACVFVLIIPVMKQKMSVGIYVSLITNILSLIEQMSWELSMLIIDFTKNRLYIKDLYELFGLQQESDISEGEDIEDIEEIRTIEFRNVSFRYPSGSESVLQNLCFKLERGKRYALVGVNGAGKSTIIKLLAGLYGEYTGEILLNEKEFKQYSKKTGSKLFHFVFQNFNHYQISIREFLSIGNSDNLTETEMMHALEKAGLRKVIEMLPNRLDTCLGKIYEEGIELSGGQWQKLIIARNILSKAQMLVLDEPTSALDPIQEKAVYEEYQTLSAENHSIMLMVSHRLGCIKWADEIFVLGEGRILEQGTHQQLMDRNGIYCNMYETQREWYHEG